MHNPTYTQGDTYPPVRGKATDEDGEYLPLDEAELVEVLIDNRSGTLIEGEVTVIDPDLNDGFNWEYDLEEGDLDVPDTYEVRLRVTWTSSPLNVQTVPTEGSEFLIVNSVG